MAKRMLIDAAHPEETRVVVLSGTRLEQFDVETSTKKQLKGNVYLAKVVRVEPSLQAAFVDYGGERHGFLSFSEIHPDYYQIPVADRQALLAEEAARAAELAEQESSAEEDGNATDTEGLDEPDVREAPRRTSRSYKIQEVIKRRQVMLIQIVKEERGNKGAALSTYLSLAGRYCVLMPNTPRGGGVSRKITSLTDRKRLKDIMAALDIPSQMAVILRTAGQERSRAEIKRDYDYLIRSWVAIRDKTLESCAPALIHEEGNLIKRAIRDIYTSDIEEILVDGDEGYRVAKDFMKALTPSHARRVQPSRDTSVPLFRRYQVDSQLDAMHSPTVQLKSGGYIVINQTEALVAIDINSGRSTKERHIEETALKTNLEAAEEIARQLRLRDLAGLVVIDFIDMDDQKNDAAVERRLKDALHLDRARIQVGRISSFGLLELSRQRLRPSLMETSFQSCPHCAGTGLVRSVESSSVHMLRVLEEEASRHRSAEIALHAPTNVALYILNKKRAVLADLEAQYGSIIFIEGDNALIAPACRVEHKKTTTTPAMGTKTPARDTGGEHQERSAPPPPPSPDQTAQAEDSSEKDGDAGGRKRRRRKRRRRDNEDEPVDLSSTANIPNDDETAAPSLSKTESETENSDECRLDSPDILTDTAQAEPAADSSSSSPESVEPENGDTKRRRRSRRGNRQRRTTNQTTDFQEDKAEDPDPTLKESRTENISREAPFDIKEENTPSTDYWPPHTPERGDIFQPSEAAPSDAFSIESIQGPIFVPESSSTQGQPLHPTASRSHSETASTLPPLPGLAAVDSSDEQTTEIPRRRGWWRR